jgi:hypothetical protein
MPVNKARAALAIVAVTAAIGIVIIVVQPASTRTVSPQSTGSTPQDPATSLPVNTPAGIGIGLLLPDAKNGKYLFEEGCEITFLQPNQPAALSGQLAVGDLIVAVAQGDGAPVSCRGREFNEVVRLIEGPEGSEVRLTVTPADRASERKVVRLTRELLQGRHLVGKEAPDATISSLVDGSERKLSDFREQIVVLEFWTSTCSSCIMAVRGMQTFPAKHPDWEDRVALIALSVDQSRELAIDRLEREDWKMTQNVWGDEDVRTAFDANALPLVVVMDAGGKIVAAGNPQMIDVQKIVDGLLSP